MQQPTAARTAALQELLSALRRVRPGAPALIGIDGYDGVGKSALVIELLDLGGRDGGRVLMGVSFDGFHRPRAERRRAGDGPEAFYRGSFDTAAFIESVVRPLRAGQPIIPAIWDVARDRPVARVPAPVPDHALVLVDGIFLHRPELVDLWDASVWVDAPFSVTVPRGIARFPWRTDPSPDAESNRRYVEGQRVYEAEAAPREHATWILDNEDLEHPVLRPGVC
ncbi:uridine kinase [Brachybacterium hainanense]|uniref:Uridine kinase n=1 Tax=Brachybacterium hainanense TaxID=1541174 RepID=A0ABV6RGV2_9MICO